MRKSLWVAFFWMGLALVGIPLAWALVDSGKERILITEEVLGGDPEEASGVTLRVASHWSGNLLWDTEYTVGSGQAARSGFTFSAGGVEWGYGQRRSASADFLYGAGYGTAITVEGSLLNPESVLYPEIARAVAGRTRDGEALRETVRIGDYYEYYPAIEFGIQGTSVDYSIECGQSGDYLSELFRIPTAEDRIEVTLERDQAGDFISCAWEKVLDSGSAVLADASAFGETGCYYAFCLEDPQTGERAHRGENCGLFYLPFTGEDGWIQVDRTRMRRIGSLPEDAVPVGMLLEEDRERLYLTVKGKEDYNLVVYKLSDGVPELLQVAALGQERLFGAEGAEGSRYLADLDIELELLAAEFSSMTREEGGLLMTWSDNGFSFVTEEDGACALWCSGQFPEQSEEEYMGTGRGWTANHMFPGERACLFDGERLVLAAFEDWDSLNVLVAVYDRDGEAFSGLYRHSGTQDDLHGMDRNRMRPQGWKNYSFLEERYLTDVYVRGTGEEVKALELCPAKDFTR